MKIEYDKEVDCLYLDINPKLKVHHTKMLDNETRVEFSKDGKVVGIEILEVQPLQFNLY